MKSHVKNQHSGTQQLNIKTDETQRSLYSCSVCGEEFINHFCYGEHMSSEHVT